MKHTKDNKAAEFLYGAIFTRFGVPRELVTNQGDQFTSNLISTLMNEYIIRHGKSSPYDPHANGKVEISNREIEAILTKIVTLHIKDWAF